MNLNQMENAIAFRNEQSTFNTLEKLDELFKARHREAVIIVFKLKQLNLFDERYAGTDAQSADQRAEVVKQIGEAKLRRARVEREIVEVAVLLVAPDAPALLAALEATEKAEDAWANCEECENSGAASPELGCEDCFNLADNARLMRRAAIAKVKGNG